MRKIRAKALRKQAYKEVPYRFVRNRYRLLKRMYNRNQTV